MKHLFEISVWIILLVIVLIWTGPRAQAANLPEALAFTEGPAPTATETMSAGSFIINMGVTPQTNNNGLRPYGMIYDLLKNYQVPIKWIINPSKVKDGADFTYNGVDYKGGPFIIPAEFRTAAVNTRIAFWQGEGVVGITTTSPVSVPVFATLYSAPNWTMDLDNGDIATTFFSNASIPSSAYGGGSNNWKLPSELGPCDDIFALPHADPVWSSHSNLLDWNNVHNGSIWYGCHSGSALEDMFNPASPSQQTNFLAEKTGIATGGGPYSENALVLWSTHQNNGLSTPYSYDYPTDPVMQFMEKLDKATENGSEQVYIPFNPGWRPTTKVGVYDPDHPLRPSGAIEHRAGILVFGRAFGDSDRGWVLMQGGHDIAKENKKENVAAQRVFFNFAFLAMIDKVVVPSITGITTPLTIAPGEPVALSFDVPAPASPSDYTAVWTSSCGGAFTPSNIGQNVTFTPPNSSGPLECVVSVVISDACGRETFGSEAITVECDLQVSTELTQPCFGGVSNGAIDMSISGGSAPYTYSWTRTGGGSGSGSGTTISGLLAGTYSITITASNDCVVTIFRTLTEAPALVISVTPTDVACFGDATGSISLSASGGSPTYTYAWSDGSTTPNRNNLPAGTYTVTVTDIEGCTAVASATITQPSAALSVVPSTTNVACFGDASGAITLNVSGGTTNYTFLWNDGVTTQNRSGITAGTYAVTVTDANSCTASVTGIEITQPASGLSLSTTQVNADCGGNTGSITVTATGGTGSYTYDWSGTPNGDGTATITNLGGGTYAVTVTDENNCTEVISATIIQGTALSLSVVPTNPDCPPNTDPPLNSNGEIALTVSGGATPYTYAWTTSNGSGLNPTVEDQTGLTAGTYNVTVTDFNGCTASTSVTLENENDAPVAPFGINNQN